MGVFVDLTGQVFDRLTVLERAENSSTHETQWLCCCSCGNLTIVRGSALKSGKTRSCGCLQIKIRTKHGDNNSRLYSIWESMKQRCNNPNNTGYKNYGARGISVCDDWNNYIGFKEWSINNGYDDNLTLDRKNNDLGYNPDNCHWITNLEQQNNKRNNIYVTYFNETHSLMDWCRILNLPYNVIHDRYFRGWDFWTAISTPLPAHYYDDCYDYDYLNEYYEDPSDYDGGYYDYYGNYYNY